MEGFHCPDNRWRYQVSTYVQRAPSAMPSGNEPLYSNSEAIKWHLNRISPRFDHEQTVGRQKDSQQYLVPEKVVPKSGPQGWGERSRWGLFLERAQPDALRSLTLGIR